MNEGWIKLHRKILNSDMYKALNSIQRDIMIQCLLMANHEGKKWEWKGKIFECKPGQFITSLESIKKYCAKNVSIKNIRTCINKLERWEFLANKSAKSGRLITIVNWDLYQSDEKNGQDNGQRGGKQVATNKNDKKNILLSEIKISDVEDKNKEYFNITLEFWKLFLKINKDDNIEPTILNRANQKWIDQIRLIIENKEGTIQQLRAVYNWLNERKSTNAKFWASNIKSTNKLREKLQVILSQIVNETRNRK